MLTFATHILMCSDPILAVPGVGVVIFSPPSSSHCKLFQHGNLTGAMECSKLACLGFFFFFLDAILAVFTVEMGAEDKSQKSWNNNSAGSHLRAT